MDSVAQKSDALIVLGATACGKTSLGVFLSEIFAGEIISADSRQVYCSLDIGSGKDIAEYKDIPHHLIDCTSLPHEYSVFSFQRDCFNCVVDIRTRNKLPIIVGGTGMYIDSVLRSYQFQDVPVNDALRLELASYSLEELAERLLTHKKEVHNKTDLLEKTRLVRAIEIAEHNRDTSIHNKEIIPSPIKEPLILGVQYNREVLRSRIKFRLEQRLEAGMVEEVSAIHESGISYERLERLGLEYRFTAEYLQGKISSYSEYVSLLYTAICQFAKRQETWFRGMERKGMHIHWIQNGDRDSARELVSRFFCS